MLDVREVEHLAELRRIQDVRRMQDDVRSGTQAPAGNRTDPVAVDIRAGWSVLHQHLQLPAAAIRAEHGLQHCQPDPRLMAERADLALTGIQERIFTRGRGQWIVPAVVVPNPVSQLAVTRGAADPLDPRMLVGRDGLRGQLSTEPVGLLGHHDLLAKPERGQCRRAATQPTSDDHQIRPLLPHRSLPGSGNHYANASVRLEHQPGFGVVEQDGRLRAGNQTRGGRHPAGAWHIG